MVTVQEMGQSVVKGGVYPWIQQENFQPAPGRRVPGLIGPQRLAQSGHDTVLPPCSDKKQKPLTPDGMRGGLTAVPLSFLTLGRDVAGRRAPASPALPLAFHPRLPEGRFQPAAAPL